MYYPWIPARGRGTSYNLFLERNMVSSMFHNRRNEKSISNITELQKKIIEQKNGKEINYSNLRHCCLSNQPNKSSSRQS